MVMAMDTYYAQDRLQEIWKTINTLHMSYLEMEESPQKLEQRNKLEECIKDYLYLAPHRQKFCFQETAEVLHMSARNKKDFSGYRATLGWQAIGMYAGNLLSQPWRKEYREVKLYSGFYVHQIDANLIGAEIMFEVMGYKHMGNGVMILDGPICPDRVTQVSQDSLVAYMECQILKNIWEEVSKTYKASWLDILEFREAHPGAPKETVQYLTYKAQQRQYPRYSQTQRPVLPTNMSFPPVTQNHHHHLYNAMHQSQPQYIYGTNGCYGPNFGTYPNNVPPVPCTAYNHMPVPFQVMKPNGNEFYYTNGYNSQNVCPGVIPTGNLIDIGGYDVPDGAVHSPIQQHHMHSQKLHNTMPNVKYDESTTKNSTSNSHTDKEEGSGTFESWDYVYRNLESQGYYKDLGERGDILSPPINKERKNVREARKVRSIDLEDAMNNLSLHRPLRMDTALETYKKLNENDRKQENYELNQSSSYDNLSVHEHTTKNHVNNVANTSKTLPREKLIVSDHSASAKAGCSKTLDVRKPKKSLESNVKPKVSSANLKVKSHVSNSAVASSSANINQVSKWHCQACTYLNANSEKVCEMCGKSKVTPNMDIEVGGAQCSRCTLVNSKDLKICEACGTSLYGSPTYI